MRLLGPSGISGAGHVERDPKDRLFPQSHFGGRQYRPAAFSLHYHISHYPIVASQFQNVRRSPFGMLATGGIQNELGTIRRYSGANFDHLLLLCFRCYFGLPFLISLLAMHANFWSILARRALSVFVVSHPEWAFRICVSTSSHTLRQETRKAASFF